MSDVFTIRVVRTTAFDERNAEELFRLSLDGVGFGEIETAYRTASLQFLAGHDIYAWRVRDERVLTSTGAAAEVHDVVIFLAGAGAAAFTAEFGKRLASMLQDLARKIVGKYPELGDGDALAIATMRHREQAEFAQLIEMTRSDVGNRVYRFADGITIELDGHGNTIHIASHAHGVRQHAKATEDD